VLSCSATEAPVRLAPSVATHTLSRLAPCNSLSHLSSLRIPEPLQSTVLLPLAPPAVHALSRTSCDCLSVRWLAAAAAQGDGGCGGGAQGGGKSKTGGGGGGGGCAVSILACAEKRSGVRRLTSRVDFESPLP
jgi:hypothetical protein